MTRAPGHRWHKTGTSSEAWGGADVTGTCLFTRLSEFDDRIFFQTSVSFSLKVSGNVCTMRTRLMGRLLQRCRGPHLPFLSDSKTKATLKQPGLQKNLGSQTVSYCGCQSRTEAGQLETLAWKTSARFLKFRRFENMVRMDTVSKMTGSARYT